MSSVALISCFNSSDFIAGGGGGTGGGGTGGGTTATRLSCDGDSNMGGAGYGSSMIIAADTMGLPYNYFSHSGYSTNQIVPLISSEILPLSPAPSHCIINSGVNDVNTGRSTSAVVNDYNTILGLLVGAGIVPVILTIPGWNNGSNTQNAQIDDINAGIASLVAASYPTAVIIDDRAVLCQFRTGGTSGNLWDLKTAYNADGVHLNPDGQAARANQIVIALS